MSEGKYKYTCCRCGCKFEAWTTTVRFTSGVERHTNTSNCRSCEGAMKSEEEWGKA